MQRRIEDQSEVQHSGQVSFIGDILSAPSILLMVLLAVLLSLSLTILQSGLQQFDWLLFAMTGMYVIWCLLGAGMRYAYLSL